MVAPSSVLLVSVEALALHAGLVDQDMLMNPVEEVSSLAGDPLGGLKAGYLLGTGIEDVECDPWGLCLLVGTVLATW